MTAAAEDAGFEVRDVVCWLRRAGPAFILLAQRPRERTFVHTVRKYGTGGINIDATRISGKLDGHWGGDNTQSAQTQMFNDSPASPAYRTQRHVAGRWPANVCISHTARCKEVGQCKIMAGHWRSPSKPGRYDLGLADTFDTPPTVETVPVWACAPGCPAQKLGQTAHYFKTLDDIEHLVSYLASLIAPPEET